MVLSFICIYCILTSFFIISPRVAAVPIPSPFICSLSSSSSISFPALRIAKIIFPELYLVGGEVSASFSSKLFTANFSFFFNVFKISKLSSVSSLFSSFSELFSTFCSTFVDCSSFFSGFRTSKYPLLIHTFPLA